MMIRTFCFILGWKIQVMLNFAKVIIIMMNSDHLCRIDGYQIVTSKVTEQNVWFKTLPCQFTLSGSIVLLSLHVTITI